MRSWWCPQFVRKDVEELEGARLSFCPSQLVAIAWQGAGLHFEELDQLKRAGHEGRVGDRAEVTLPGADHDAREMPTKHFRVIARAEHNGVEPNGDLVPVRK
jgi:hypothetical protein